MKLQLPRPKHGRTAVLPVKEQSRELSWGPLRLHEAGKCRVVPERGTRQDAAHRPDGSTQQHHLDHRLPSACLCPTRRKDISSPPNNNCVQLDQSQAKPKSPCICLYFTLVTFTPCLFLFPPPFF
uniref:Uncharacterized protein n=1 Tax=Trypanosoma vivax (strain Y486) TaxID=1055687 RepID=G0TVW4_TRYVY|nr:hypothetical protein, unlikely [Trypanosoma vivax Y486]